MWVDETKNVTAINYWLRRTVERLDGDAVETSYYMQETNDTEPDIFISGGEELDLLRWNGITAEEFAKAFDGLEKIRKTVWTPDGEDTEKNIVVCEYFYSTREREDTVRVRASGPCSECRYYRPNAEGPGMSSMESNPMPMGYLRRNPPFFGMRKCDRVWRASGAGMCLRFITRDYVSGRVFKGDCRRLNGHGQCAGFEQYLPEEPDVPGGQEIMPEEEIPVEDNEETGDNGNTDIPTGEDGNDQGTDA